MSIELKNKTNRLFLSILLSLSTLFFGAIGIFSRIDGFFAVPLISAFLAALISVEKRRIASVTVSLILIIGDIIFGTFAYFSLVSLSSVTLAVIISVFYLKKKYKFDCVLYSTLAVAVMMTISAFLYLFSVSGATSVIEAYDYFLELYNDFKDGVISSLLSATANQNESAAFSVDYLNEMFDAYLRCIVALVSILAFIIVGLSNKLFSWLIRAYSDSADRINSWRFIPSSQFAYFYFILAVLSLFRMNTESVIAVSIVNLYLIFMFVFAYAGYRFVITMLKSTGKSAAFSNLTVIALTVLFSSFALQILAAVGAFVIIKYSKISQKPVTKE